MEYNEEVAQTMLNDPRWQGAIQAKMLKVWKTRNKIPKQYFNPRYFELMKKGEVEKANQIKDKYFNEAFILKQPLTEEEVELQKKIVKILEKGFFNLTELGKKNGISLHLINDAMRYDSKKVDMRPEHLLKIKKYIQSTRVDCNKVISSLEKRISETSVKEYDKFLAGVPFVYTKILSQELAYERFLSRKSKGSSYWTSDEIQSGLHYLKILSLELSL